MDVKAMREYKVKKVEENIQALCKETGLLYESVCELAYIEELDKLKKSGILNRVDLLVKNVSKIEKKLYG